MRKSVIVTITEEGRDKGKKFLLTELPVLQAEKLALRALFALGRGGVEVPKEVMEMGLMGLQMVFLSKVTAMHTEDVEPILDEMMECIKFAAPKGTRNLFPDDIEELKTLMQLRAQLLVLHTGFILPDDLSILASATVEKSEG